MLGNSTEQFMRKNIYTLTEEEKNEILNLFERKNALEGLINVIDGNNQEIYNRIVRDYTQAFSEFSNWWAIKSEKYSWEGSNWNVDFQTKEVFIILDE